MVRRPRQPPKEKTSTSRTPRMPPRALLFACYVAIVACAQQAVRVQFDGRLSNPLPAACDASSLARVLSGNITSAEVQELHGLACPTLRERSARETLAYVTPWNSRGYAVAARHAEQLSMVAPVWLQLEDTADGALELRGQHNVDVEWLSAVKRGCTGGTEAGTAAESAGRCTLVLPRVEWKSQHISGSRHLQRAAAVLLKLLRKHAHLLDGIVLEAPVSPQLFELFSYLAERFHSAAPPSKAALHRQPTPASLAARQAVTGRDRGFVFVLVLPPALLPEQSATGRRGYGITPSEFRHLAGFVDRFSLMLYDYSMHRGKVGPNCPLQWQNATVREFVAGADNPDQLARKVLMGVPFYGYDNGEAIVSHLYLHLLKTYSPELRLDTGAAEHRFAYSDTSGARHDVYYPTPWMLRRRVELARELGTGLSIWELGQGCDYFFNAL